MWTTRPSELPAADRKCGRSPIRAVAFLAQTHGHRSPNARHERLLNESLRNDAQKFVPNRASTRAVNRAWRFAASHGLRFVLSLRVHHHLLWIDQHEQKLRGLLPNHEHPVEVATPVVQLAEAVAVAVAVAARQLEPVVVADVKVARERTNHQMHNAALAQGQPHDGAQRS